MKSDLNKSSLFGFGGIALCLFLAACVTTQDDMLYMNDQVVALNSRVNKIEESMGTKLSTELDSKLNSIRSNQAELGAELDRIKGEVQGLSGRVDDNKRLIKHTVERDTTGEGVAKETLSEISDRLSQLETQIKQIQADLGLKTTGDMRGPYAKTTPLDVKKPPPKQPPVVAVEREPVSSEEQSYGTALATFKKAEYDQALISFKRFIEEYPKSDLTDNAQFWIGECYMGLEQYEQAILAYQEVIKKYPKGNKVPNAMLRQALAFYEIKDKISSRLLLKKIIKEYPNSSEAKIANTKLKTLN
jgi:tol-pal system protein YbgF